MPFLRRINKAILNKHKFGWRKKSCFGHHVQMNFWRVVVWKNWELWVIPLRYIFIKSEMSICRYWKFVFDLHHVTYMSWQQTPSEEMVFHIKLRVSVISSSLFLCDDDAFVASCSFCFASSLVFCLLCVFKSVLVCCNCQHLCHIGTPTPLRTGTAPSLPSCVTSSLVSRTRLYYSFPFLQNINLSFCLCSFAPPPLCLYPHVPSVKFFF